MKNQLHPPVGARDHIRGPQTAQVTLVQYGDYECPVSLKVYRIAEALRQRAADKVRYVYRHFPLNKVHPHAEQAAIAAEAAGVQGKYWEMHDRLLQNQNYLEEKDLARYAQELQLNLDRFSEMLKEDTQAARVREDQRFAIESGIDSTSNLFINERRYRGVMETDQVAAAVDMLTGVTLEEQESSDASSRTDRRPSDTPKARQTTITEICAQRLNVNSKVLESVLTLALEIAREGREGRKIGTLFTVGDTDAVMRRSRPLVMDPLFGHPDEEKHIDRPDLRETIKELAQLDGGFVVTESGVVRSAARHFDASSHDVNLPLGLGSRHMAGASISRHTQAIAVVVSESSMVRLFQNGELETEIVPELWMLRRYGLTSAGQRDTVTSGPDEVTVVERPEKEQ